MEEEQEGGDAQAELATRNRDEWSGAKEEISILVFACIDMCIKNLEYGDLEF